MSDISDNHRPYYDALETREPAVREAALFAALPGQIAHARAKAPYFAALFADLDPAAVTGRAALAKLPVTRKSALIERQKAAPPFGGLAAVESGEIARIFASPGPIYEPQSKRPDYWRFARGLHAAGVRRGDLLHNCFAYHFTPAGAMVESAAHALGCVVFPGGVGNTEAQVRAIADLKPAAFVGTPSFLKIILEKGREMGADLASLNKGLVGGEALPPSLRDELAAYGVAVLQCYATAELGLIAYESPAKEGMILDEGVIVEIVTPGTGDPVAEGEVGEVLVTVFTPEYPLIRFATGDLSAVLAGPSPCGRTNTRIVGWLGRGRPDHQGQGHVRPPRADRRGAGPLPGDCQGPPGGRARGRGRCDDAPLRGRRRGRRLGRGAACGLPAQRPGRPGRPGQPGQRRQGHRRPPRARLSRAP